MVTQITRDGAKNITLQYLYWFMSQQPLAHRTAPVLPFDNYVWSVPDMIAQVQNDTYVGIRYTNYYVSGLGQYEIVE